MRRYGRKSGLKTLEPDAKKRWILVCFDGNTDNGEKPGRVIKYIADQCGESIARVCQILQNEKRIKTINAKEIK